MVSYFFKLSFLVELIERYFLGERGIFCYFLVLYSTLLHAAIQIPTCWRMLGPNTGLLKLRHWLSDALTTRLDLIHNINYRKIQNQAIPRKLLPSCRALQSLTNKFLLAIEVAIKMASLNLHFWPIFAQTQALLLRNRGGGIRAP
jgi:hypothetical protein